MTSCTSPSVLPTLTSAELALLTDSPSPIRFTQVTPQPMPYIPIPHPTLKGLSLTLPALNNDEDLPNQLRVLNDYDRVSKWLAGPPYPYSREDATGWNALLLTRWTDAVERLRCARELSLECLGQALGSTDGCGVQCIRLADVDAGEEIGTGRWIGDLGIVRRWEFEDVADEVERRRLVEENLKREVGDEQLVWCIGFFLDPDYHGQNIVTTALRTLIDTYLVSVLRARHIKSTAYFGNYGSRRVHEKCGFRLCEGSEFEAPVSKSRGGGLVKRWVFEWQRDEESQS